MVTASAVCLPSFALLSCKPTDVVTPADLIRVGSIAIDTPSFSIEIGTTKQLTATVKDTKGKNITIPVVWRSTIDSIARLDAIGRLAARDTGIVAVTVSSLGVTSPPVGVRVVWNGPATIEELPWTPSNAVSPAVVLKDSIRVLVKNRLGVPSANTRIRFSIVVGGGAVSPQTVTTVSNGYAATAWTLGPAVGPNTISVSVVDTNDTPMPRVAHNAFTRTVNSYLPIVPVSGDAQSAQILGALPVIPVIKLVDSTGAPRLGVSITFSATRGGRVEVTTASTAADGTGTPGTWTLGDLPGDQQLVVSLESAIFTFHATATGTPIYYSPPLLVAGAFSNCGLGADSLVSCWGRGAQTGGGDTVSHSLPTPTTGGITFASVAGGASHYCGISTDQSLYCWGPNALVDTSGLTVEALKPTRLGSAIVWKQVSAGSGHNCAIAADLSPYCWGDDSRGQLGDRGTVTRFKPVAVSGGFTFTTIAAGAVHNCGLTSDGTALCWGANQAGQIGDGTTGDRNGPTLVAGGVKFQSIGAGDAWSCGLSLSGKAHCWGVIANAAPATSPVAMEGAPTFPSISVGGAHACGLAADGTAYCWGANTNGQLGDSTTTARATPVRVVTTLKFASISAGSAHTCARTIDGAVACWGQNRAGELGDKIAPFRTTPRFVVLGVNP